MINAIDGHFAELQKAQEKEKAQPQHEDNAPEQPEAAPQEKPPLSPKLFTGYAATHTVTGKKTLICCKPMSHRRTGGQKWAKCFSGDAGEMPGTLGQLNAGELTEGQVKELYAKAQEQPGTGRDDTFSIYQLKDGDETRDYRF